VTVGGPLTKAWFVASGARPYIGVQSTRCPSAEPSPRCEPKLTESSLKPPHTGRADNLQEITASLEAVTAELAVRKDAADAVEVRVRELKEVAHAKAATVAKLARARAAIETALEALMERRTDILRACPLSLLNRNRAGGSGAESRGGATDEDTAEAMEVDGDGFTAAFMGDVGAEAGETSRADGGGNAAEEAEVDYSKLARHLRVTLTDANRAKLEAEFKKKIDEMTAELAKLAPNLKAVEQYEALKERERVVLEELDTAKEATRVATEAFQEVKTTRTEEFMKAFNHIADHIDPIYKELTIKPGHGIGGTAYLTYVFVFTFVFVLGRLFSPPLRLFLFGPTSACRGKSSSETWAPSSAESVGTPCGVRGRLNKVLT
jgi:chromosome segregation ATPase